MTYRTHLKFAESFEMEIAEDGVVALRFPVLDEAWRGDVVAEARALLAEWNAEWIGYAAEEGAHVEFCRFEV